MYPNDLPPKITIITIVYNDKNHIIETMDSVINQTYTHIEYIIIDGASNDGTKEIIESRLESISTITTKTNEDSRFYLESTHKNNPNFSFKFLSEKDSGIYDAMNKGIDLATGVWCNFMNAGDRFYEPQSIQKLFNAYNTFMNGGGLKT